MIQTFKKLCIGLCCVLVVFSLVGCGESPVRWTVTFDTGEGGSDVPSQSIEDGGGCPMPSVTPAREGYHFIGWALEDEAGELWIDICPVTITADVTHIAVWMPECDCDDEKLNVELLQEGLEIQIKQDYYNQFIKSVGDDYHTLDDVSILANYGVFGGCAVVSMKIARKDYFQSKLLNTVGGITFLPGNDMTIWKDGQFYGLRDAYDQGFLTAEDLQLIYKREIHRGC